MTPELAPRTRVHPGKTGLFSEVIAKFRDAAESPLLKRIARGTAWNILGMAVPRALGLVGSIIAARLLGKETFGELSIVQSTIGLFGLLAGLGLGATATKYIAQYRDVDSLKVGRIIALSTGVTWTAGLTMAILLFVCSEALSVHALGNPGLTNVLRIVAPVLLLGSVIGSQTGILGGFEAFRAIAHINCAVGLATLVFTITGAYFGGLQGAAWGIVLSHLVNYKIGSNNVREVKRQHNVRSVWIGLRAEIEMLWAFSAPVTLASLMVIPTTWLATAMLAKSPFGYSGVAEYAVGNQWRATVMLFPTMLTSAAVPMLSSMAHQGKWRAFRATIASNVVLAVIVAGTVGVTIWAVAPVIAGSYGSGFESTVQTIQFMAVAGLLSGMTAVATAGITGLGKAWQGFAMSVGTCGLLLGSAWILIPSEGPAGLAAANVLAYASQAVVAYGYLWRSARYAESGAPLRR